MADGAFRAQEQTTAAVQRHFAVRYVVPTYFFENRLLIDYSEVQPNKFDAIKTRQQYLATTRLFRL